MPTDNAFFYSIASELRVLHPQNLDDDSPNAVAYAKQWLSPLVTRLDRTRQWLIPCARKEIKSSTAGEAEMTNSTRALVARAILKLVTQNDSKALGERQFAWPETLQCDAFRLMHFARRLCSLVKLGVAFRTLNAACPELISLPVFASFAGTLNEYPSTEEPWLKWLLYTLSIPEERVELIMPLLSANLCKEDPQYQCVQARFVREIVCEACAARSGALENKQALSCMAKEVWGQKGRVLVERFVQLLRVNFAVFSTQYDGVLDRMIHEARLSNVLFGNASLEGGGGSHHG